MTMTRLIAARMLSLLVTAYWAVFFALLSLGAAGRQAPGAEVLLTPAEQVRLAASALGPAGPVVLASASAIVCALFAWAFLTILLDTRPRANEAQQVVRQALVAALVLVMGMSLPAVFGVGGGALFANCALQIVVLLACHFAVQFELRRRSPPQRPYPQSEEAARLLAVGAAHNSLLNRLWKAQTRPGKVF